MRRKNEYRGKHIHAMSANKHLDGRWVFGYLSGENYIAVTYPDGMVSEVLVDKTSIGQYIGKQDKEGNKIFEWDIVELASPCGNRKNWLVVYENAKFHLTSRFPDTDDRLDVCSIVWESVRVIGNYTDNPELLNE